MSMRILACVYAMARRNRWSGATAILCCALQLVWTVVPADAADVTWTGGGAGGNVGWLTPGNWSPSGVPTNTDTAIFGSGGTSADIQINMTNNNSYQFLGALKFDAANTVSRNFRNTSANSNGVLVLNGVAGVLLRNESNSRLTLSNGLSRLMDVALAASGEIYTAADPSGVSSIECYSSIINYVGTTNGFTKTGPGTLSLRSANTFGGPVTNSQGDIRFNATGTIGTGVLYLAGGNVVSTSTRGGAPIANPIVVSADTIFAARTGGATNSERIFPLSGMLSGSTGKIILENHVTGAPNSGFTLRLLAGSTFNLPIEIGSGSDVTTQPKVLELFNAPSNGVLTLNGVISGDDDGSVRRAGDANGVSVLTGANTYTAGTRITSGYLFANNVSGSAFGTGTVTVTNAGVLGGSGSIAGAVTLDSGGAISPGAATNVVGNLTLASDLIFANDSKMTVHITGSTGTPGTDWDVVTVGGTWTDAAAALNPVVVKLDSLGSAPSGWNSGISRTWKIVDGGAAAGFDATHFTTDATAFAGTVQGVFSFSVVSGDLFLTYTPAADIVINVSAGSVSQGATTPTPYPLLTGTFGVLKVGNGEVVFTNSANDYVGVTKIYAGTGSISVDALNGSGALGAAASAVLLGNTLGTSNATFNINTAGVTNGRDILVQSGSTGTKTIGTTISSGTAYFNSDITLQGDVTLSVPAGGTAAFSGAISGGGNLTKTNAGTVAFSAPNTYTGKTRILSGTLTVDAINRLGTAPASPVADQVLIDGSTLEYTGSGVTSVAERGFSLGSGGGTIAVQGGSGTLSIDGPIVGGGALTKLGTNRLDLNNPTNIYAGDTLLNEGEIGLDGDGLIGAGTLRLNGGTLGIASTRSTTNVATFIANPVVLNSNSTIRTTGGTAGTSRLAVFSGAWAGTGGTLTISNSATATDNTFDLRLIGSGFNFTRPIVLDNGTGTNGLARLFLGNIGTSTQTFSGAISGNGRIRRSVQDTNEGGVTIFTAANTYSGGTEVAAGKLLVNNTTGSGTGSGTVTLSDSGILGGTGAISGAVAGDGTIAPGASAGTLTLSGGLDLSTNGTYLWELATNTTSNPGAAYDTISLLGGSLALGGTSTLQLAFTNAATTPDSGNPFWQASRSWTIVTIGGAASNPGSTAFASIINGTNAAGSFTNFADGSGNIILQFTPSAVPPPPQPVLSPVIAGANTASATITWSASNGYTYTVQMKTNLTQANWTTLGTSTASGSTASFIDTTGPRPQSYYRVIWP